MKPPSLACIDVGQVQSQLKSAQSWLQAPQPQGQLPAAAAVGTQAAARHCAAPPHAPLELRTLEGLSLLARDAPSGAHRRLARPPGHSVLDSVQPPRQGGAAVRALPTTSTRQVAAACLPRPAGSPGSDGSLGSAAASPGTASACTEAYAPLG